MKIRLLSLFIAAALAAGAAGAATASGKKAPPGTPQQQAARAEIDRLVKRIEELSSQLGDDGHVRVIVRELDGHPEFSPAEGKHRIKIDRLGPGEAPRALGHDERVRIIEREGPGAKWKVEGFPGREHDFGGPGLGIVMASNPAASGVRIAAVTPDSPAMRAGIRTDDVLLQVNGKAIAGAGNTAVENARAMIGKLKQGQVVKLRYARQGKTHDASVKADEIRRVWAFSGDAMAPKARGEFRGPQFRKGEIRELLPPGVAMEVQRIGIDCEKGKKDCGLPVIYEAFRWQGLNLASVDAGLGRYFGTQRGVLVLSSGEDLKGLQSGDVIQKVGGAPVDSPRDVMRALRDKDSGERLRLDLLRDRKPVAVTVTVPKSRPLPFITPPPPPAPPAPPPPMAPRAPRTPHAAPLPPAPPPAPAAPTPLPREGAVWIEDGEGTQVWIARGGDTPQAIEQVEVVELPAR